jgi:hypothetical protein
MHVFASLSIGTEAGQIILAQDSPNVPVSAPRTVPTKASIVPRTIFDLAFGINVQERTLLFVAGVESRVEITFRHFCHVIFVEKFAAIALFTKRSKPMLAHDCLLFRLDMAKRTEFFIASP